MRHLWEKNININVKIACLILLLLIGTCPVFAQDIGTFTKVEKQVEHYKTEEKITGAAKVNDKVVNNDAVSTAEQSRAQVKFVDQTFINIAPKSKITIEDYMYNKGTLQVIDGVMETITPANSNITIKTSTAVAGIRG